jgi:hypothetical protein
MQSVGKLFSKKHLTLLLVVAGIIAVGYVLIKYAGAGKWVEHMSNDAPKAGGPGVAAANLDNPHVAGGDLNPASLLPGSGGLAGTPWAASNPAELGDLKGQNFLTATYQMGVNTVSQNTRNPTYDLRAEPVNPKMEVGPWMQSTIEPDTMRRGLGDITSAPSV